MVYPFHGPEQIEALKSSADPTGAFYGLFYRFLYLFRSWEIRRNGVQLNDEFVIWNFSQRTLPNA